MKNIKFFMLTLLVLVNSTSCKEEIDELFLDPDGSTETKIEYLWASMITGNGSALRPGYNPTGFYLTTLGMGPWSQATTKVNDGQMMNVISNMSNNNWGNFFTNCGIRLAEMETLYQQMSDEEKDGYDLYLHLGKILRANGAQKLLDLYGDMPWTDAFKARSTDEQVLFPTYDSQEFVWKALITELGATATALKSITLSNEPGHPHSVFPQQDFLNGGDLDKWIKFANSLRLRFAMRISNVDEAYAKPIIEELLDDELVETNLDNIIFNGEGPDGQGIGQLPRAAFERPERTYGTDIMVDIMNDSNDPRREVYFNKTAAGTFAGLPSSPDVQGGLTINQDNYSIINTDLVANNQNWPGSTFTAAEVQFIRAEAILRGLANGDAQAAYEAGLRESVDYYYWAMETNTAVSYARPDPADIDAFVTSSSVAYDGTLEQVLTQKWIHFGMQQAHEAWADYRRTGMPTLPDDTSGGTVLQRPKRIIYPASEWVNNEENYNAIRDKDTQDTALWWDVD